MTWAVSIPFYAPHRKIQYSGADHLEETHPVVMWMDPLVDEAQLPAKSPACPLRKFGMSRATGAVTTYPFPCMSWERCGVCALERAGTQLGWLAHLFTRPEAQIAARDWNGNLWETPYLKPIYYCEQPFSRDFLDTLAARRRDRKAQYRWIQRAHPDFPENGMLYLFADKDMNAQGAADRWSQQSAQSAINLARSAMKVPGVLRVDGSRKWAPKAPKTTPKYWALEAHKRDLLEGGKEFCQHIENQWGESHVLISPLPDEVIAARPVSWCKDMLVTCVEAAKKVREAVMEVPEWRRPENPVGMGSMGRDPRMLDQPIVGPEMGQGELELGDAASWI